MDRSSVKAVLVAFFTLLPLTATRADDNAVDRVRRHEPKMSYLDNGVIRLGIDLNIGGSITYLSRSGSEQNLVNRYDFGRQIQMSYYSGPVPFSVEGKPPKPEWSFIGWNPIQVGDAFGNASRLVEHRNDAKRLSVKCVPMHWPLDNVPGECTYECWFELEGAPDPKEIIDWNIEHEYQYQLIVGTLPEIRKYVYDHAERPSPPAYHFEKDRRGWFYVNAVDGGWPIRGELNVLLEQDDPQLHGPLGLWQASHAGILVIQAASHTTRSDARVFWKNLGDQEFSESKSAAFQLTSDREYRTYRINLASHPAWKGPVVSLRLDPVGAGGEGEWIRIKSIALEK